MFLENESYIQLKRKKVNGSSIKDHDFIAKRPLDLSLSIKQLIKLKIKVLDYNSSIVSLYNDRKKRFNQIKYLKQT